MAISHVQPLLLLLASLFFLPVLCAIKFQYCNDIGYDFANITGVLFSPKDDDTRIIIFGNAKRSLIAGDVSVRLFIGASETITGRLYSLNDVANVLPIKPDTSFVLTLDEVPFDEKLTSYDRISVTMFDDYGRISKKGEPIAIMCIDFHPHSSTTSAALSE